MRRTRRITVKLCAALALVLVSTRVFAKADSRGSDEVISLAGVTARGADIALAGAWGDRPPRTRIVAIGAYPTLDAE